MKKWLTIQQLANDIAALDKSEQGKELSISKCNNIAKSIKNLYARGGKYMVVNNIYESLPSFPHAMNGLSVEQKDRVQKIVEQMFKWHWVPFSRIRINMMRIAGKKSH